jgi:hypothetical protein
MMMNRRQAAAGSSIIYISGPLQCHPQYKLIYLTHFIPYILYGIFVFVLLSTSVGSVLLLRPSL